MFPTHGFQPAHALQNFRRCGSIIIARAFDWTCCQNPRIVRPAKHDADIALDAFRQKTFERILFEALERNNATAGGGYLTRSGEQLLVRGEGRIQSLDEIGEVLVETRADGVPVRVRGVWRDYARQFGTVAIDRADYQRITGDSRLNDLALWLEPGADAAAVQAALRALLPDPAMLDFASAAELRRLSLRIFDRSFAVTYYLQAVAIVIGFSKLAFDSASLPALGQADSFYAYLATP